MKLRIRMDPPGWFAMDTRLSVRLDGEPVYEGSFTSGFVVDRDVAAGAHAIETEIRALGRRTNRFDIALPDGLREDEAIEARLAYSRFWGRFEKTLAISTIDPSAPVVASEADRHMPALAKVRATWALLGALALVYVAELVFGLGGQGSSPSVDTLVAMGGLLPSSVADGEWFRLVSCTFLHADFMHILFNAIALVLAGLVVESLVGPRWFLATYFAGGLGGSLISLALNPGDVVSVGASGAIMGVFATGLFVAQTLPLGRRGPVQFQMLRVLVPSLIPLAEHGAQRVDLGAHLGGAIAGAVSGALLLALMRRAREGDRDFARLRTKKLPLVVTGAFGLAAVASFAAVTLVAYPEARAEVRALAPNELMTGAEPERDALERLLAEYPDDPRIRLQAAEVAIGDGDLDAAALHVARGRAALDRHGSRFTDEGRTGISDAFDAQAQGIALRRELVSNAEWATIESVPPREGILLRLDAWLERFPNDPRLHVWAARRAFDAHDAATVARHAALAREALPRFSAILPSVDAAEIDVLEGLALLSLGRDDAARRSLEAHCGDPDLPADLARLAQPACGALSLGVASE